VQCFQAGSVGSTTTTFTWLDVDAVLDKPTKWKKLTSLLKNKDQLIKRIAA